MHLITLPLLFSLIAINNSFSENIYGYERALWLSSIILFTYINGCMVYVRYLFEEDFIVQRYSWRLYKREKAIFYKDIQEVRYINDGSFRSGPMIVLVFKGKKYSRFFNSSNSFTNYRFKMRMDILLFLHSKDLPIVIKSNSDKDKQIIELTNANGIWNYYTVIDGKVKNY